MHVDTASRQEHVEDQIMREEHMYSVKTGLYQVNIQKTGGLDMDDCLKGSSSNKLGFDHHPLPALKLVITKQTLIVVFKPI